MKKIYLFFLAFAFLSLIVSIYVYYNLTPLLESHTLYSSVYVNEEASLGFDLNDSALTFGNISVYGTSLRKVTLNNPYTFPVYVNVKVKGSISKVLLYEPITYVEAIKNTTLAITAVGGDKSGFYDGYIKINIVKANS
jgi:hypothetical protein